MSKIKYGKASRREGISLHPKADKIMSRRTNLPGKSGAARMRKLSEYGIRLREKQKAKRLYGMSEAQFRRFFRNASKKKGVTGEVFLRSLEMRLDNVVYRLKLSESRPQGRQLVSHGHIMVNGKKVNIPSYLVSKGDEITVKPSSAAKAYFKKINEEPKIENIPRWLKRDAKALAGEVLEDPAREELEASVDEQLIIEYYSR